MKIISSQTPIIETYSNFDFKKITEKAKGLVGSGKVQGLVSKFTNNGSTQTQVQAMPTTPTMPVKKGMSKGLKIGIISGGVLLLGVIGFVIYKNKKK